MKQTLEQSSLTQRPQRARGLTGIALPSYEGIALSGLEFEEFHLPAGSPRASRGHFPFGKRKFGKRDFCVRCFLRADLLKLFVNGLQGGNDGNPECASSNAVRARQRPRRDSRYTRVGDSVTFEPYRPDPLVKEIYSLRQSN